MIKPQISYKEIPVISFTYLPMEQIPVIEGIITSSIITEVIPGTLKTCILRRSGIEALHDRYVLFSSADNLCQHYCHICEILKKDIEECNDQWIKDYYQILINRYGKELVDLLVIEDYTIIINKITKVLEFTFDQVYKTSVIRVNFPKYMNTPKEVGSIPFILYSTLKLKFCAIHEQLFQKSGSIIIKKRSDS